MPAKKIVEMLLEGGQGSRLGELTKSMAKPAVPFGGKYRIIDFPLSNCVNSDIDTVGVLTQYEPLALNAYLGNGQAWDLDRNNGGVFVLPPYASNSGGRWYYGTADAIYKNTPFIDQYNPEYVLILSGDHIYKMNYAKMLDQHKKTGADCTISVMEVPWEDAPRFGIMNVDGTDTVTEFEEKPAQPKSNYAVTGLYFYSKDVCEKAKQVKPSARGELEITTLNEMYLQEGKLDVQLLGRGYAWLDTGTMDSLVEAADFVRMIEQRQGIKISAPEEIAYKYGWINRGKLLESAERYGKSPYGQHLRNVADDRLKY